MAGKSMTQPGEIDTMVMHMESGYSEMIALWKNVKEVKRESVNESIQLPHGMELGKVFTGHGKSFVKEEVEPTGNMAKIQKIVKDSQATKLGGVMIDMQSANLLMKLWNAVSDKDKEKMNKLNPKVLTRVIEKLWSRVNLRLPI
jgi:flagellar hook-basal body complex protein FliE